MKATTCAFYYDYHTRFRVNWSDYFAKSTQNKVTAVGYVDWDDPLRPTSANVFVSMEAHLSPFLRFPALDGAVGLHAVPRCVLTKNFQRWQRADSSVSFAPFSLVSTRLMSHLLESCFYLLVDSI